ncbi:hypothetical protein JCM11641_005693 [Rhodosporidiobolus odoratus]
MRYPGQPHHPHPAGTPPNAASLYLAHPPPRPRHQPQPHYVPSGLELVQAHWIVRHGERSPVRQRLLGLGDIPSGYFPLCSIGRDFNAAVLSLTSSTPPTVPTQPDGAPPPPRALLPGVDQLDVERRDIQVRRVAETPKRAEKGIRGGIKDCDWGDLTDLGRLSTLTLGRSLRCLYVDQLGFLPSVLSPDTVDKVAFRSTNMPRTMESLLQVVEGLWGRDQRAQGTQVEYAVRHWSTEDLYPNTNCKTLRELDAASIKLAAKTHNPVLAELDPVLEPVVGHPVRIDSSPRANGILDTVLVCRAHGIKLHPVLEDPKIIRALENAVVHEWFDAYSNPTFRKLAMGRFFSSLRQTLQAKIEDPSEKKEKVRLAVYSAHDTSVAGVLNALDIFDGRWPPFTSHIAIELFRSTSPPSFLSSLLPSPLRPSPPHYIRLRFNSRTLRLPTCTPPGKHLEGSNGQVCTWEAFKEALGKVECSGEEWREACGGNAE